MRLGIIAAAGAEPTPDPVLGERDAVLVRERLTMADLGFAIEVADPSMDLAEQLDELLGAMDEMPDAVFFASCLLAVVDDGECYLCLNPQEPDVGDSLRDVAGVLSERAARALMVLDLRYDDPAADRRLLSDTIEALRGNLPDSIEVIAAIRPVEAHPERIPSRLTAGILEALDDIPGTLSAKQIYASVVQRADLGSWPHAVSYIRGQRVFHMRQIDGEEAAVAPSEPPPEVAVDAPPKVAVDAPPKVAVDAPPEVAVPQPPDTPPEPSVRARAKAEQARIVPDPLPIVPPPAVSSASGVRPSPPSERAQSATVSVRMRKQPSSQPPPSSLPKVMIGDSRPPSSAPADSVPAASSSAARSPSSQPPRRERPRELLDTQAEGPEAKRQHPFHQPSVEPTGPFHQPSVEPTGPDLDDSDEISVEIEPPSKEQPSPPTPAPPRTPPPERSSKKPADMSVDDHVELGDALREDAELDEAIKEYKRALGKMGTETTPERAAVYLRIAEVMQQLGKKRVAISNYDKALSIQPHNVDALEALIDLNAAEKNWRAVHKMEDRFFGSELEPELRYEHLMASAARWSQQAADQKSAKERLYQAHELFDDRLEPLEGLLAIYEVDKKVDRVIDLRGRIAELTADPAQRARKLFELGEYCMFEVGRESEALAAFEQAIETDPTMLEALEVLATALADGQEWGELERVYHKMINKFSQRALDDATKTVLAELHRRLALLYRDHLFDPESALGELDEELALRPDQLSAQLLAADVALEVEDAAKALGHLRHAARLDPKRSETYHQLFTVGRMLDDPDATFLAASAAVLLDAADDRERIVYREHKSQGVPKHERRIREGAWRWLKVTDRDEAVEEVMRALSPAVLRARVGQLERDGKLPQLPPSGPQEPERSTVSVVRSFGWACNYLNIETPDIYVSEQIAGSLSAPFAHRPTVLLGREVISGRTLVELAFLVGRHVATRIPEHELVAHMQTVGELSACFMAALKLVVGSTPSGHLGPAVDALAAMLQNNMTDDEADALDTAVHHFSDSGGRVDLNRWVANVEICATRAGLLLCGDLETAITVIKNEQPSPFASVERRIEDLLAFVVSEEHAKLRRELGSNLGDDSERPELLEA